MKAARVKGLKPTTVLADGLQRIIVVRLRELCAFMPVVEDPSRVTELHDMRIAAKRLRDVLELSAGLFGPDARLAARRTKALQGILGEIRDCDVTLPLVIALTAEAQAQDVAAVTDAALTAGAANLDPASVAGAAMHIGAYRGLASMAVYLRARRALLFTRFLEQWRELEREGFRTQLLALCERPLSHDGHVAVGRPALPSEQV